MKKKDQKKLIIALVILAGVILAGLGVWNYAESNGNFLKFNQKSSIEVESEPVQFQDSGMDSFQDSGMDSFQDSGMDSVQTIDMKSL